MTLSGNNAYNSLITDLKLKERRHPKSTTRVPYTYMISLHERYQNFIRRMSTSDIIDDINY
jgi:hypothetical protein